jgi:hypothetical protein
VLPDFPTGIEQGVPNLEAYTWNAIFLSKEASAEMVNKLNRATVEAMESPNVSERLEGLGAVIVPPVRATPEYPAHCAQRDREMDGADQGKRGDRGVSRIVLRDLCAKVGTLNSIVNFRSRPFGAVRGRAGDGRRRQEQWRRPGARS